jgi:glycogen synthase
VKLLIYSHFFAPSVGGVEAAVLSLARGIAEIRTPDGAHEFDVVLASQTAAHNFDDQALPFRVVRQPGLLELWRLVHWADVVHLAGPSLAPLALAWLAKKSVVIEHHGYQAICPNGLLVHQPDRSICPGHFQARRYWECLRCQNYEVPRARSFWRLLLMFPRFWLSRKIAVNLAITKHVAGRHGLPRPFVIYYGIEDPLLSDWQPLHSGNTSRKVCFAYVGRLVAEKGIPLLLLAAKQLRQDGHAVEVRLIGDGPERMNLEQIIKREGLENCVSVTGYLSGSALADAVKDVSVVVMPSIWEETAGLAAIEQMMRGRLVIAADIGGLGEVVGDAALRFPPGEAAALANRMREVLRDPAVIDSLGRKARERATHLFLRKRMTDEHAAVYRKLRVVSAGV